MKKIFRLVKHLPHTMFNLMLSLSASAYVVVVFLIKEGITFSFLPQKLEYISYIIYLMAPVLVAWLCLRLSKHLSVCGMECQIEEIELASHSFLPNYLGYFFVALSIPNVTTLIYVYAVIAIWCFAEILHNGRRQREAHCQLRTQSTAVNKPKCIDAGG